MWLLIDDERDLKCDVIARSEKAAKPLLALDIWECVCFDHDLGLSSATGYRIMKWMLEEGIRPKQIQLVTANPVGKDNMEKLLIANNYWTKDHFNFFNEEIK